MVERTTQPHEEVPAGDMDWVNVVMQSALCNPNTIYTTYGLTRRTIEEHIPGDYIECGVFAGAQAAVMAHVLKGFGVKGRHVLFFDSFEGIPHAGNRDTNNIGGKIFDYEQDGTLKTTGIASCSLDQVIKNLGKWEVPLASLAFHKGWFQNTVPAARDEIAKTGIAILRLDGDLYDSTMVCMENLFPLLNPGGYLIIDDWYLDGAREAVKEYMATFFKDKKQYADSTFTTIPKGGGPVWWKMPLIKKPKKTRKSRKTKRED